MNNESAIKKTLRHFSMTTTLHGFKYLCSSYYIDRIVWVICCCASTCCAGVLCAVLWARFTEVPALLALRDMQANGAAILYLPDIVVCPPIFNIAEYFHDQLNINSSMSNRLSNTVERIIAGKRASEEQLLILEQLLSEQNVTLTDVVFKYSPECEELMIKCRWQHIVVPCKILFEKKLTHWGVCCVMKPNKAYYRLDASLRPTAYYEQTRQLDLSLHCSNLPIQTCKFLARYESEAYSENTILAPGYVYFARLTFTSVPMNSAEEFLVADCVSDKTYSREVCLDKCAEEYCGCSDPLRNKENYEGNKLPPCSIAHLQCLNSNGNDTCKCLPACYKISSDITLESNTLNLQTFTVDPIYSGLNALSTVVHIKLNIPNSITFTLNPIETWLTLLSSLGGVFNMFLGVGLFSAIEILLLLLVKLPSALMRSPFY